MMWLHKSFGTTAALLLVPRITIRLASKSPAHLPGPKIQQLAANASHLLAYFFIVFMPVSGVAMGYYGGKGLPFWFTTIPGAVGEQKSGAIAKSAYQVWCTRLQHYLIHSFSPPLSTHS